LEINNKKKDLSNSSAKIEGTIKYNLKWLRGKFKIRKWTIIKRTNTKI